MKPENGSLVMGGHAPGPLPGSLVMGGTDVILGRLFDKFLARAIPCNGMYLRLEICDQVALVRRRKADIYTDIKVKFLFSTDYPYEGESRTHYYWDFAGYLKHSGILFGSKASYVTARCEKEIRPIVFEELIRGGRE